MILGSQDDHVDHFHQSGSRNCCLQEPVTPFGQPSLHHPPEPDVLNTPLIGAEVDIVSSLCATKDNRRLGEERQ